MRNRVHLLRKLMFPAQKDENGKLVVQKVTLVFREPKDQKGGHGWDYLGRIESERAFVVHHDFRSWRPEENQTGIAGDRREGYAQLHVSRWDLTNIEREAGGKLNKDTKIIFQDLTYSLLGLEQFQQRDMLIYDLKRIYD